MTTRSQVWWWTVASLVQACEDELHRLDPRRWPATVELFGEPGLTSPGIVRAGLIAEDPTAGDR